MAAANEEELLSSLEESLDLDYNDRGGFVSSFMLPTTLDTDTTSFSESSHGQFFGRYYMQEAMIVVLFL